MNKLNKFLVLNKNLLFLLLLLFFGSIYKTEAQDRIPYDQGTKYILAKVSVTGKTTYNEQTIVTFTGLEKGQEITVPGEEISAAIKKLGKLGLFSDIDFFINKTAGDSIYIDLNINELPKLSEVKFIGIKKGQTEKFIKDNDLKKGKIVNENLITTTRNYIENKYKKDGFYNSKVIINSTPSDTASQNQVNLLIRVDKGDKVKVDEIAFSGNKTLSDKSLRGAMKNTKEQFFLRLKSSKYIKEKYQEDLDKIVAKYKERGYRDMRILSDTIAYNKEKNKIGIKIKVEEGRKYYFGNLKFIGNSVYPDDGLRRMIGINKGDTYNAALLEKRIADKSKPDGEDITNLYQNNGYLFSNINVVETRTYNDTIDFDIRIQEGPLAYFNKITVVGNDKTNDEVVYRELRTKPGQKYSKEDIVRTVREIGALGFFDPETINPQFKNVDASAGTVDIEYQLKERGASQIELQGGYGGNGFIGTLGLSFNNFSVKNLFNKDAYRPVPSGDGQKVALRLQASTFFQTYSFSFSEPWFGGRKPISFNSSISYSKQFASSNGFSVDRSRNFNIFSVSSGIVKRLTFPDDLFYISHSLSFQYYSLSNYNVGLLSLGGNGSSRNFAYTIGLTRNSKGANPIFPTYGSEFSISAKLTPPYSLFNGIDYSNLNNQPENKLRNNESSSIRGNNGGDIAPGEYIDSSGNKSTIENAAVDNEKVNQVRYNWLEYYKFKFKADWYTTIYKKLVLRSLGEFGYLGNYNNDRGNIPFERFFIGGDGLANYSLDSREVIQLRGYQNQSLTPISGSGGQNGALIYNKFSFELRYPITLKPSASIYALSFYEAGAGFDESKKYSPFQLQRSAGFGIRVFMPAFGLLGLDFGRGFDPAEGQITPSGWQTHFIIGQQF